MALTTLLVAAFVFSARAIPSAKAQKNTNPPTGVFRVVLNGFKVNHESDDDILERDGKRDEVYLRSDVWVLNRDSSVPYRRSLRSVLMGDINNQTDPRRIAAGTASADGGLRTNDKWPISEPWRRVRNPLPDRPPMLLWEGTLVQGENMAWIMPTVWEWDSRDPSPSEILWDGGVGGRSGVSQWFDENKQAYLRRIENKSRDFLSDVLRYPDAPQFAGDKGGTRPIGVRQSRLFENHYDLTPRVLVLTYDAAVQAVRSTPSSLGYGVIAINYADQQEHGDYTLYVQVEQIK
jgi:hypothetical protein